VSKSYVKNEFYPEIMYINKLKQASDKIPWRCLRYCSGHRLLDVRQAVKIPSLWTMPQAAFFSSDSGRMVTNAQVSEVWRRQKR